MSKVVVKVPKRSGFDKSHQNLLTSKCGTLTPILVDEIIPNTKIHLNEVISASLPPLASDTFMRCNLKVEAFFCPSRLLYGGLEDWLTDQDLKIPTQTNSVKAAIPVLAIQSTDWSNGYLGNGTLMDYLGVRNISSSSYVSTFNIFPLLAYHRIYDDWYRNTNIQQQVFSKYMPEYQPAGGSTGLGTSPVPVYTLPYSTLNTGQSNATDWQYHLNDQLADGVRLGSLRQRNFGFDYFTSAFNSPQRGSAQGVTFSTSGSTGNITIAALRAANSLQQFAERNQLAGRKLQDYVKANYGADLSSGVAQRSLYLGSGEIPVYSKGIYQQSNTAGSSSTQNPMSDSVGAQFGSAQCSGKIDLISDFVAQEPGYLMVLASLVPVVTYASGIDRMMLRYNTQSSQTDMATPLLQNVGNEPIYGVELTGLGTTSHIFGYTERFASFKTKMDTLHGLLRDGASLQSFALQRTVTGSTPTISSSFLEIPTSYLDQVAAVAGDISNYGVWIDTYADYKVSMPLAEYSIPSLQDPAYEHGNNVVLDLNGSKL